MDPAQADGGTNEPTHLLGLLDFQRKASVDGYGSRSLPLVKPSVLPGAIFTWYQLITAAARRDTLNPKRCGYRL